MTIEEAQMAEMTERIENRREFNFGYWTYGLLGFTLKCCCCFTNRLKNTSASFRDKWMAYNKFQQARDLLHEEKDMMNIIKNFRIMKFMQKATLKKR